MKVFYRKLDKYLLVLTFLCFLASCSSSKRIAYFQDLKPGESELFTSLSPHYIKVLPGDKITILINSRNLSWLNYSIWQSRLKLLARQVIIPVFFHIRLIWRVYRISGIGGNKCKRKNKERNRLIDKRGVDFPRIVKRPCGNSRVRQSLHLGSG